MKYKVILHGSFGNHFEEIREAAKLFSEAGVKILAPESMEITAIKGSFLLLESEEKLDPYYVELRYLHNLQKLGPNGFSYFVNPNGYIGKSAAFEFGIALATNVPCYFSHKPKDLPVYVPNENILSPQAMINKIGLEGSLPQINLKTRQSTLYKMMQKLVGAGSVVAAGGIIEYQANSNSLPEVLLVKTHKWGHKYSMVGGKVRRGERLHQALIREVKEETGLKTEVGAHICTFDQIKNSGYYQDYVHHMFVDYVAKVESKKVRLNDEAQDYIWAPAEQALAELNIEPNAKHTLQLYTDMQKVVTI
jgi:ADP-ribose pyrophosphatase YjhB (NUDIX family)